MSGNRNISLVELLKVCRRQNIPFAAYRIPMEEAIVVQVQCESFPRKLRDIFEIQDGSGFLVAPFVDSVQDSLILLEPDFVLDSNSVIDPEIMKSLAQNELFLEVEQPNADGIFSTSRKDFCLTVNAAKGIISEGNLRKVVVSKVRKEKLDNDFNAIEFYLHLCEKYPNAFVSMIQLPALGCWIGASPELLLSAEGKSIHTESLAGTQIATDSAIESYSWGEKEIEEQAIVTNYVQKTLQSVGVVNSRSEGPSNHQAANLIHLKTSFEFQLKEGNQYGALLDALHPTPSVGGMPKELAREFILAHEKHDRKLYAGYLGALNIAGKTNLYVNLRCLQLFDDEYVLYSGAGITSGSIAEKEWEETENKMMTLRRVLGR